MSAPLNPVGRGSRRAHVSKEITAPQERRPTRLLKRLVSLLVLVLVLLCPLARAADNQLTDSEQHQGWLLLFDGRTLDGWMTSASQPGKTPVEQSALNPHRRSEEHTSELQSR